MDTLTPEEYLKPMDEFTEALLIAYWTGDESKLQACPEGREFLLELKKRQQKWSWLKAWRKKSGKQCVESIDKIRMDVILGEGD